MIERSIFQHEDKDSLDLCGYIHGRLGVFQSMAELGRRSDKATSEKETCQQQDSWNGCISRDKRRARARIKMIPDSFLFSRGS
jgi:hypothetical protein